MNKIIKEPVVEKEYFTVKVEVLTPVILTYRILAETPEQAVDIAVKNRGNQQFIPPSIVFSQMRAIKASVYKAGTNIIRYVKNL